MLWSYKQILFVKLHEAQYKSELTQPFNFMHGHSLPVSNPAYDLNDIVGVTNAEEEGQHLKTQL